MSKKENMLNILLLDNVSYSSNQIRQVLGKGGFKAQISNINTIDELREKLKKKKYDAIISECPTSKINCYEALKALNESGSEVPFIIVSKPIGEEKAIDLIRNGAYDFISVDNIKHLAKTIKRSIKEKKIQNKSKSKLGYRYVIEKLVADISTKFINVKPEEIENEINAAIKEIGQFAGVDRSYIFEFNEDQSKMSNTYEWCNKGIEQQIHNLQELPVEVFPWWIDKLKKKDTIYVPFVAKMPKEANAEKEILEMQKIKSLVVVPMILNNQLIGFMGFDSVRSEKTWNEKDIILLKTISNVFVSAFERMHIENEKQERNLQLQSQQKAIIKFATNKLMVSGNVDEFARYTTEISADIMNVERVSIWLLSDNGKELMCKDLYERTKKRHSEGQTLNSKKYPKYFKHLKTELVIDANEAQTDERTEEFCVDYLIPLGITSMLDAGIIVSGELVGILCHEHIGKPRRWADTEIYFVNQVAEQIAGALINRDRRAAIEKQRASEEKLRHIIEHSTNLHYSHTTDHVITYVSPQSRYFLGCEPEEAMIKWTEFMTDNPVNQEGYEKTQRAIETGETQPPYLLELTTRKGNVIWVEVNEKPVVEKGQTKAIVGSLTDITERKKAEESLKESEEQYKQLVELSPDAVMILQDDKFVFVNNAAVTMFKAKSKDDFIGKPIIERVHPDYREIVKARIDKLKNQTTMYPPMIEEKFIKFDGTAYEVEITANQFIYKGKDAVQVIARDITKRKLTEKALIENEKRYRALFDLSPSGIILADERRTIIDVNHAFCNIVGYKREDLLLKNINILAIPEDVNKIEKNIPSIPAVNQYRDEVKYIRKDRSFCEMELRETVVHLPNGETGILTVASDITERKRAEETLLESEEKFRTITASAQDAIIMIDSEGNISSWNKAAEGLFGYSHQEVFGIGLHKLLIPQRYQGAFIKGMKNFKITGEGPVIGKTLEVEALKKDGTEFLIGLSVSAVKIKGKWNSIAIIRDITERKCMEEELRESEERFRTIYENSTVGIYITTPEGEFVMINPTLLELLGYSSIEDLSRERKSITIYKYEEDKYRFDAIMQEEGYVYGFEAEWIKADGTNIYVSESARAIIDKNSKIKYYDGVVVDITERKMREKELKYEKDLLQNLMDNIPDTIYFKDKEGKFIRINKAQAEIFGLKNVSEAVGMRDADFFAEETSSEIIREDRRVIEEGIPILNKEKKLISLKGEKKWVTVSKVPTKNLKGEITGLVGMSRDITNFKRMQTELIVAKEKAEKSDKLKSEFLAQMSHEIRTPLNGIMSSAQILLEESKQIILKEKKEEIEQLFGILRSDSRRIYKTVDSILQMSELITDTYNYKPRMIEIIEEIIDFQYANYKSIAREKGLELNFIKNIQKMNLNVDEYSVSKIFEELLDNAIKFSKGGRITIETNEDERGFYVEITDNGIGFEKDKFKYVFEMFSQIDRGYTRQWDGCGLGLALVKTYCDINNITIDVKSEVGKGTRFTIIFA